jgi:hypothetical protein
MKSQGLGGKARTLHGTRRELSSADPTMPDAPPQLDPRTAPPPAAAATPAHVGGGGCSAAERGASSPALGPGFTKPFRWEIVPEPNPDCATSALGEADTRDAAEADLRRALAGFAAGFGFLYEVTGRPPQARELARIAVAPPAVRPPAWATP